MDAAAAAFAAGCSNFDDAAADVRDDSLFDSEI